MTDKKVKGYGRWLPGTCNSLLHTVFHRPPLIYPYFRIHDPPKPCREKCSSTTGGGYTRASSFVSRHLLTFYDSLTFLSSKMPVPIASWANKFNIFRKIPVRTQAEGRFRHFGLAKNLRPSHMCVLTMGHGFLDCCQIYIQSPISGGGGWEHLKSYIFE